VSWSLTDIWRHPIKAHGAERVDAVTLEAGAALPWDRIWAVAHEAAKLEDGWSPCANFSRGAKAPALMAITTRLEEATGRIHLSHPALPDLTIDPETDGQALVDWSRPLIPEGRAASAHLHRVPGVALTDTPFASVSLLNAASNRALGQKLGQPLDQRRWRGNLWVEGLAPWEEFDLVGKTLLIGEHVQAHVAEPITRCLATTVNPDSGARDADTLGALNDGWGHQDFGVYLEIRTGGPIRAGDSVRIAA
jgi:hypothetical protein